MTHLADTKAISLILKSGGAKACIVETEFGYVIDAIYDNQQVTLATTRGHIRHFQKLDTAFDLLKSLGCVNVSVSAAM